MRRLWRLDLVLAAALVAAGALRFWGLLFGLPHTLARPDELAVISLGSVTPTATGRRTSSITRGS